MTLSGSTVVLNGGDGIYNDKKGHLAITSKSIVESRTAATTPSTTSAW